MASMDLTNLVQSATELLRDYRQASDGCPDPNRRFSPLERERGRDQQSRKDRASRQRAARDLQQFAEPIADALERADIDSTAWLKFTAHLSGEEIGDGDVGLVTAILLRLHRRMRLGLLREEE